jgi:hypothetical protein
MRSRIHLHLVLLASLSVVLYCPAAGQAREPSPSRADSCPSSMQIFAPKPPILGADPSERHEETRSVATRLIARLDSDGLFLGVDSLSFRSITISVGRHMLVGLKCDSYYYDGPERVPLGPCPEQTGLGWAKCPELEGFLVRARKQGGMQFIQELTLFETNVPMQHDWHPEVGMYRILWRGVATGFLEFHN